MKCLFFYLLWPIVRLNLSVFAVVATSSLLLRRMGFTEFAFLIEAGLIITPLLGPLHLGRSIPLLLSAPYSRNALVAMCGAINLIGAFISFALVSFQWLLVQVAGRDDKEVSFFWESPGLFVVRVFWRLIFEVQDSTSEGMTGILLFVSMMVFFFFSVGIGINATKAKGGEANLKSTSKRIRAFLPYFLGWVIGVVCIFLSKFIVFAFLIAYFNHLTANMVSTTWIFSPKRKKNWHSVLFGLSFLQIGTLLVLSFSDLRYGEAKRVINAASFLGVLGPKMDADFILPILEKPLSDELATRLAELVTPRTGIGSLVWYRWDAVNAMIPYRKLIQHQQSEKALSSLVALYDPKTLTGDDLLFLLDRRGSGTGASWAQVPGGMLWVNVPIDEKVILEFFQSREEHKVNLAIRYAEFHPTNRLATAVKDGLIRSFSSSEISFGITALANALGRELDYRTYLAEIQKPGGVVVKKIDCSDIGGKALASMKIKSDEATYNRCLREFFLRIKAVEAQSRIHSWQKSPQSYQIYRWLREVP